MNNIINFSPVSKFAEKNIPCPKPAKGYAPDWYKNIPEFRRG
jgi:hypothetical protein